MKAKYDSHKCCSCDNEVPVLFGICYCTVDIEVGTGNFAHVWTRASAIAHVSVYGSSHQVVHFIHFI